MYGVKSFSRAGAKNRKPLRGGRAVVYSGSAPVAAGQVESADPGGQGGVCGLQEGMG